MLKKNTDEFLNWLESEILQIRKRLGLTTIDQDLSFDEFQIDETILFLYKTTQQELDEIVCEITNQLRVSNLENSKEISKELYSTMDEIGKLVTSLEDGNLLGVESFSNNIELNLINLKEKLYNFDCNINLDVTEKIAQFIFDIQQMMTHTNNIFAN